MSLVNKNMTNSDISPDCFLGIQYGDFDGKIKSSSDYNSNHDVRGCKLNKIMPSEHSSAWCASDSEKDKNPWIQVNFGKRLLITGVSIQGRADSNQYITKFRVLYSNDGTNFSHISEFTGNSDNTTVVKRLFPFPIYANIIRIQVLEYVVYPSLRFDLHYIPNEIPEFLKNKILSKYIE